MNEARPPPASPWDCPPRQSNWDWETDRDHNFRLVLGRTRAACDTLIAGRETAERVNAAVDFPSWTGIQAALAAQVPFHKVDLLAEVFDAEPPRWLRLSGTPITDKSGAFSGFRGTCYDVTDEKDTQAALKAAKEELNQQKAELIGTRIALGKNLYRDPLTHVRNSHAFRQDLHDRLKMQQGDLGLLQIDIDRFKWVIDTLGHQAGDAVLTEITSRLLEETSAVGTLYRLGGDQFAVLLLAVATPDLAMTVGHRIVEAASLPLTIANRTITVNASIGIAFGQASLLNEDLLMSHASAALQDVKNSGGDGVRMSDIALHRKIDDQRRLAADIPLALKRGEFIPYFQPQIDLNTGQVTGAEALVRWQHPQHGLLSPAAFLQAATEMALIDQIDRHMLRMGLYAVQRLNRAGHLLPVLSINMSEARLLDPRLPTDVGCLWQNTDCRLSFELLETIDFERSLISAQLRSNLSRIRNMGVGIEVDDFGSGRASLTGLLQIAPDRLKIDRGLVSEIVTSRQKRKIVQAIVDVARALEIPCLAEGVETDDALQTLRDLGCQAVQGFIISKPLSETDFRAFLDTRRQEKIEERGLAGLL